MGLYNISIRKVHNHSPFREVAACALCRTETGDSKLTFPNTPTSKVLEEELTS